MRSGGRNPWTPAGSASAGKSAGQRPAPHERAYDNAPVCTTRIVASVAVSFAAARLRRRVGTAIADRRPMRAMTKIMSSRVKPLLEPILGRPLRLRIRRCICLRRVGATTVPQQTRAVHTWAEPAKYLQGQRYAGDRNFQGWPPLTLPRGLADTNCQQWLKENVSGATGHACTQRRFSAQSPIDLHYEHPCRAHLLASVWCSHSSS